MKKLLPASLVLALAAPFSLQGYAQTTAPISPPSDIKALKQEIQAMRSDYEVRLQAMEQRLKAAEAAAASSAASAAVTPAATPAATPTANTPSTGTNSLNPAISLILSGNYARTSRDPASSAITGFHLPKDAAVGLGTRGFSLAETELGLSASIDPWLRGAASISLHGDNTLSVEEAFVQTTSLGQGFTLKAGRFFSGIGYLNAQHAHTWDFVDNPLAYQAMLGTQYGDDGLQLKWLAPTEQFLQLGVELGRGRSFPGSDTSRNGAGMVTLTAHTGGDVGDSHSWRTGLSLLNAKATQQQLIASDASGNSLAHDFSGSTRVVVADAVWKWAPNGNATRTYFKLQGEYVQSTRSGSLAYDVAGSNLQGDYRAVQSGWYLQGVYQLMPSWRVGVRTEQLNTGTAQLSAAQLAGSSYKPGKNTLMLDYNPSEFSRVRLQFAREKARQGFTDNQLILQYQMSLGAHGAHAY